MPPQVRSTTRSRAIRATSERACGDLGPGVAKG
jgi:hypothetical protein